MRVYKRCIVNGIKQRCETINRVCPSCKGYKQIGSISAFCDFCYIGWSPGNPNWRDEGFVDTTIPLTPLQNYIFQLQLMGDYPLP
jgi:hypothetical protein